MTARLLIIDDEITFGETCAGFFREEGFACETAHRAEIALEKLAHSSFDIVLLDICLPDRDGIELLKEIKAISPQTLSIIITAYGSLETAVQAMRLGSSDYIQKPVNFGEALIRIQRLLDQRGALQEIQLLKQDIRRTYDFENIVGHSPAMEKVFELIKKVSTTMCSVLITGESGTGKELVARAIHNNGEETRKGRFVAINCAAIPDNLLESELFGHARGAFTGAVADKKGLLEVAEGGSVLLDEIGDMSPAVQAKLLRAIEQREIVRVGGADPIPVHAKFLCSTHRDLEKMVAQGRFRDDLFHRINVVGIRLPPLRERREDIPLLIECFVRTYNRELKKKFRGVTPEVVRAFLAHDWKGNVRELANAIERAMIFGNGPEIQLADMPPGISGITRGTDAEGLHDALKCFERWHILHVLRESQGNKEEASRRLGISLSSLYRKIDELEIDEPGPQREISQT